MSEGVKVKPGSQSNAKRLRYGAVRRVRCRGCGGATCGN